MTPWLDDGDVRLFHGDNLAVLRTLPDKSVHMCATSPPFYGLRDYGTDGQIGLEETPDEWVQNLVQVFREVRRVIRDDGTLWVEIGDSYTSAVSGGAGAPAKQHTNAGSLIGRGSVPMGQKSKDLLGQPWLLAFALRADGWWLRSEIIWARPNPMPESVTDRPTKSHSTVFLLSKQPRYFYDADAIREPHTDSNGSRQAALQRHGTSTSDHAVPGAVHPESPYAGANARSVWTIPTQPTPFAHFATWPEALVRRMILAGTSEKGCCPECGAAWVREVERSLEPHQKVWNVREGADPAEVRSAGIKATGHIPGRPSVETLGWSPSCTHDHQPVPCTVLDPFAGSATTNLVARNHGRHSIGIELNEDYLKIAAKRLQQLSLLA